MKMTLREALAIQAQHIEHYGILRPDLPALVKAATHVYGCDLDAEMDIVEVNQRVPRGAQIEWMCGINNSNVD